MILTIQNQISQSFNNLSFEQEKHIYRLGKKILPSVSSLIKKHVTPFDELYWAEKTAKKNKSTVSDVLKLWENKRKNAAENGTKVHTYAENWWNDVILEPTCNQELAVKSFLEDCLKNERYTLIQTEVQMYSQKYQYAGTCDLLLWDNINRIVVLFDYKTNIDLDKAYGTLLEPFPYLADTPFNKYQIQLSYYQIMLEEIGIGVNERYIVWLKQDGSYELRKCNNFTELLKNYMDNEIN